MNAWHLQGLIATSGQNSRIAQDGFKVCAVFGPGDRIYLP
jgi:hypothetical protein